MKRLLDLYLESRYRGRGPLPADHPDYPVFLYEDQLAAAFFHRCLKNREMRSGTVEVGKQTASAL